jgi:hypothetical protein
MRFFSPAGFEAFLVAGVFAGTKKSRRQKPGNGTLTE